MNGGGLCSCFSDSRDSAQMLCALSPFYCVAVHIMINYTVLVNPTPQAVTTNILHHPDTMACPMDNVDV